MPIPPEGYPRAAADRRASRSSNRPGSTNADVVRARRRGARAEWPHLSVAAHDRSARRTRPPRPHVDRAARHGARGVGARAGAPTSRRVARGWIPLIAGAAMTRAVDRAGARHRAHRGPEVAERRAAGRRQALRHPRRGRAGRSRRRRHRRGREHPHDRAPTCRSTRRPRSRRSGSRPTRIACSPTTSRALDEQLAALARRRRGCRGRRHPRRGRGAVHDARQRRRRCRFPDGDACCAGAPCASTRTAASSSSRRASSRRAVSAGDVVHVALTRVAGRARSGGARPCRRCARTMGA